jgi:NAD-dependent SIR2 family protein deacetylase
MEDNIQRAADALRAAEALIITAGAGIGVDSGLPDFRGNEGFWKAYPPMARLGLSFVEMASPGWFQRNPRLAWGFYGHRLHLYRRTTPHLGFSQLLEIAKNKGGGYFVFTSNVDGQFQKAGYSEERIEECHGSIHYLQCSQPCSTEIWKADALNVQVNEQTFLAEEPLPRCKNCERIARPNVLMFGDWYWISQRTDMQSTRRSAWLKQIRTEGWHPAIVEVGAGEAVATVRRYSEYEAKVQDATLIRINPRDFRVPGEHHISLPMGAAAGIDGLTSLLAGEGER